MERSASSPFALLRQLHERVVGVPCDSGTQSNRLLFDPLLGPQDPVCFDGFCSNTFHPLIHASPVLCFALHETQPNQDTDPRDLGQSCTEKLTLRVAATAYNYHRCGFHQRAERLQVLADHIRSRPSEQGHAGSQVLLLLLQLTGTAAWTTDSESSTRCVAHFAFVS